MKDPKIKDPTTYFISYTISPLAGGISDDKKYAIWVEYVLREIIGAKTIMREYDFAYGDNFKVDMDEALKEADVVIGVLTRNYLLSENCKKEWTNAKHFIPVRFDDCQPEGLLTTANYIDLFTLKENDARERLVMGLQGETRPTSRPGYPIAFGNPAFPIATINSLT